MHRPAGVRAGFHADLNDRRSGLTHAGEQWAAWQFMIPSHTHNVWELYLQMHGTSQWIANDQPFVLRPGHLFGVAPGIVHHMAAHPPGSHHFYYAGIEVATVVRRHPTLAKQWQRAPATIHRVDAEPLAAPFEQLMRELAVDLTHATTGLALAVDRVVLEASRCLGQSAAMPRMIAHPAVTRVKTLLDRHYERAWTTRELADQVGLAPTYLTGLFTSQVGMPPHTYLNERRIERAKQLLEMSGLPVTAVGIDVGFGSSQYFARVFRKITGYAPREYRRLSSSATTSQHRDARPANVDPTTTSNEAIHVIH